MIQVLWGAWQLSLGGILESVWCLRGGVEVRLIALRVFRKELIVLGQQRGKSELPLEARLRVLRSCLAAVLSAPSKGSAIS